MDLSTWRSSRYVSIPDFNTVMTKALTIHTGGQQARRDHRVCAVIVRWLGVSSYPLSKTEQSRQATNESHEATAFCYRNEGRPRDTSRICILIAQKRQGKHHDIQRPTRAPFVSYTVFIRVLISLDSQPRSWHISPTLRRRLTAP